MIWGRTDPNPQQFKSPLVPLGSPEPLWERLKARFTLDADALVGGKCLDIGVFVKTAGKDVFVGSGSLRPRP